MESTGRLTTRAPAPSRSTTYAPRRRRPPALLGRWVSWICRPALKTGTTGGTDRIDRPRRQRAHRWSVRSHRLGASEAGRPRASINLICPSSLIDGVRSRIPDRDTFTGRRHHASLTLARPIRRRVLRRQGTYSDNRPISPALTHQKVRRRKGADAAARAVTAGRSRYVGPAAGGDHLHRRCSRHSDPSLLAARRYPLHHCRSRVSGDQSSMMTELCTCGGRRVPAGFGDHRRTVAARLPADSVGAGFGHVSDRALNR